jgi:hypothetical protein
MPKPVKKLTAMDIETVRSLKYCSGKMGFGERVSTTSSRAPVTMAKTSIPIISGDVQGYSTPPQESPRSKDTVDSSSKAIPG